MTESRIPWPMARGHHGATDRTLQASTRPGQDSKHGGNLVQVSHCRSNPSAPRWKLTEERHHRHDCPPRLICFPIHQSKIAGTVPPRESNPAIGEYRDLAPTCMFPAREATPSPTLQQRHRGSRTAAYPPGTHRPAAGSQRAELHHLQGPAGRDRPLFSVSGTAAAPNTRLPIAPRRRSSPSGDARRPGRRHRAARQPCRAMWPPSSQHTTLGPGRQACGLWH